MRLQSKRMASSVQPKALPTVVEIVAETGRPPMGLYQLAWRRFLRHKMAIFGLVVFGIMIGLAIFGPMVIPYDQAYRPHPDKIQACPVIWFPLWGFCPVQPTAESADHLFGTDDVGRDLFARVIYGGRISITIGLLAMLIAMLVGVTLGALAGFYGGWVDSTIDGFTQMMLTIPGLFLLIILGRLLDVKGTESVMVVIVVLGAISWMRVARLVRGSFFSLKQKEFVESARCIGVRDSGIVFRHILPNTMAPVIVNATLVVADAIITEAAASFLGLGVQPPIASWGSMLERSQAILTQAPWVAFFPGLMIVVTVLSINFVGDGLRDALDPRTLLE